MKYKYAALALIFAFISLSCSDFKNNTKSTTAPKNNPDVPAKGSNPFEPGFDPNVGEFSEDKMLANIGLNVIAPQTRKFQLEVLNLESEIGELCSALEIPGEDTTAQEEKVKQRWTSAMLAYHKLDALPLGPVLDRGRYLADNIYAWPNFNSCGVDLEVVKRKTTGKQNLRLLFTLKGLGALEYLFFEQALTTTCNPKNASHKAAFEWAQGDVTSKKLDRCKFAQQLVHDLGENAGQLENYWNPEGLNFSKTLVDGSRYSSLHEATNAVSDALFSVETMKDLRLGRPLGLNKDCANPEGKCPEMAEHPWSGLALKAVNARLDGFKEVVLGSSNPNVKRFGLDDALSAMGRKDVADHLLNYANKTQGTTNEVLASGTLQDQIGAMNAADCKATTEQTRLVPVCVIYREVRELTVILKTEFLTALSLRAPPTHAGDND